MILSNHRVSFWLAPPRPPPFYEGGLKSKNLSFFRVQRWQIASILLIVKSELKVFTAKVVVWAEIMLFSAIFSHDGSFNDPLVPLEGGVRDAGQCKAWFLRWVAFGVVMGKFT